MGCGRLLTFGPQRTSKYVTKFSNHVHGVGWVGYYRSVHEELPSTLLNSLTTLMGWGGVGYQYSVHEELPSTLLNSPITFMGWDGWGITALSTKNFQVRY